MYMIRENMICYYFYHYHHYCCYYYYYQYWHYYMYNYMYVMFCAVSCRVVILRPGAREGWVMNLFQSHQGQGVMELFLNVFQYPFLLVERSQLQQGLLQFLYAKVIPKIQGHCISTFFQTLLQRHFNLQEFLHLSVYVSFCFYP